MTTSPAPLAEAREACRLCLAYIAATHLTWQHSCRVSLDALARAARILGVSDALYQASAPTTGPEQHLITLLDYWVGGCRINANVTLGRRKSGYILSRP